MHNGRSVLVKELIKILFPVKLFFGTIYSLIQICLYEEEMPAMPLYGFVCEDCNDDFEELVMSSAKADDVVCPNCGSRKVQRQLSLVAGLNSASSSISSSSCSSGGG
ncbi:MAG: zinc ribbon domain-containing protein [Anaerolineales bacterium]